FSNVFNTIDVYVLKYQIINSNFILLDESKLVPKNQFITVVIEEKNKSPLLMEIDNLQLHGILNHNNEVIIHRISGENIKEDLMFDYIQNYLLDGINYLDSFHKKLLETISLENHQARITFAIGDIPHFHNIHFFKTDDNCYTWEVSPDNPLYEHYKLVKSLKMTLHPTESFKEINSITLEGRITINIDSPTLFITFYPSRFTYGKQSMLESFEINRKQSEWMHLKDYLKSSYAYWKQLFYSNILIYTLFPFILGSLADSQFYNFNYKYFIMSIVALILILTGATLINDYFDHISRNDATNIRLNMYKDKTKFIQKQFATPERILLLSLNNIFIGGLIGLYLNYSLKNNSILILGIVGIFLAIFYSAEPIKLSYRGFSEIVQVIIFGPLVFFGGFILQTNSIMRPPDLIFISLGQGIFSSLFFSANSIRDIEVNKISGKKTTAVKLGINNTFKFLQILFLLTHIILAIIIFTTSIPSIFIFSLIVIGFYIPLKKNCINDLENITQLTRILKLHYIIFNMIVIISLFFTI
ncbi:MAG: prenyltransferase, partial [Candidatus Heimdallarchaeota archaeon]|nr:prenyltransferase [Candidatus Heimdallarchaeota archaeon]